MGAAGAELMLNGLKKRDKNDIDVQKARKSAEKKRSFTLKNAQFSVVTIAGGESVVLRWKQQDDQLI